MRFKTTVFTTLLEPDWSKKWRVRFKTTNFTTLLNPDLLQKVEGAFQNHSFYYTFRPRLLKKVEGAFQNHSFPKLDLNYYQVGWRSRIRIPTELLWGPGLQDAGFINGSSM